jgi:hypothetical protein
MKWIVIVVLALVVGFGLGWSVKPNAIRFRRETGGMLNIHPRDRDVITWENSVTGVRFRHSTPCKNPDLKTGTTDGKNTCEIDPNKPNGLFVYDCDNCRDPGVGHGDYGGIFGESGGGGTTQTKFPPPPPTIYCENGVPKADDVAAATNQTVQWFVDPSITGASWTISGLDFCSTLSNANPTCTPNTAGTYTYTVTVKDSKCMGIPRSNTLQVGQ